MNSPTTTVGLVLAGGASRRMGRDKATLPFGAETMLARVVRTVASAVNDVVVVARPGQAAPTGVTVVFDNDAFQGPLAALVRGMEGVPADVYFVAVCDQPLLVAELIPYLFARIGTAMAAVPVVDARLVPTCAVYRRGVLESAKALLASGERRLGALTEHVDSVRVLESELRTIDPDLRSFLPCNTPEEYQRLLALAGLRANQSVDHTEPRTQ